MPIRNGEYVLRTEDEIFATIRDELLNQNPNANPEADATMVHALIMAVALTVAQNQEESLKKVYESAYVIDAEDEELTKKARNLGVVRQEATKATGVVTFSRDSAATTDYVIPTGTTVETLEENPVAFETTDPTTINGPSTPTDSTEYTTTSTSYTAKTSHTVEAQFRDSLDVSADIKTSNSSYAASIEIIDTTNGTTIATHSTTSTTYTTVGPDTYDVSGIDEPITIEYRLKIGDSSATASLSNALVDLNGQTGARTNITAVEGGSNGNVGPNSIVVMPSKPTGVESVTNNNPTGDPSLTDTDGIPLRVGYDREDDDELRKRVLDTDAVQEGPSADGVELALEDVKGLISKDVNSNPNATTTNGIDPYKTEVVAYGGDLYDIVETLAQTMSVTTLLRLQGGVNGTKDSTTYYVNLLDELVTVPITRPTMTTFDVTIDVVHESDYGGDIDVKDAIVDYVGGTYADDSTTTGIGIGENVLVNEMENVAEDVQGVDYADVTLVDQDGDGTDDTTTDSDGVPILSISDDSVARVDADNITVNTTAR